MAEEDQTRSTQEETRAREEGTKAALDMARALIKLNSTVQSSYDRQVRFQQRLAASDARLKELAAAAGTSARALKQYQSAREAHDKEAIRGARELAREQIDAARSARSLAGRLEAFAGANVDSQKRLMIMGEVAKATGDGLKQIGNSAMGLAGGLARGETKFATLNPVIDSLSNAGAKAAETIPFLGQALASVVRLSGDAFKFLNERLQTAVETFQELGNVGALTVRGMSGVQEQFIRSGMSLEGFRRAVTTNADTLSRFGGTVGRGAEEFSKIVGAIIDDQQGMGQELRRLGFSADAIGEAAAGFVEQQTRLGLAQGRSTAELARGAANYARELDTLTKLTGMQREAVQKQQQAALSESRFRAKYSKMVDEGRGREAKAMMDFQTLLARFPQLAQGVRDLMTGFPTSEEAQKVFRMGAPEVLRDLEAGIIGPTEAFHRLQQASEKSIKIQRELSLATGDAVGFIIKFAEAEDFRTARLINGEVVLRDQQKQQQAGTDTLTDATVGAQQALEGISRQLNALSFRVLPNFGTAVSAVTRGLNSMMKELGLGSGLMGPPAAAPGGTGSTAGPGGQPSAPGATGPAISGGRGGPAEMAAAQLPKIREMIGRVESSGNYNALAGGGGPANLTNMTVADILALQKKRAQEIGPTATAVGKYQFTTGTLRDIMGKAGVGLNDRFDQTTQDKLADYLIKMVGYDQYASNPTPESKARFLQSLARTWRGLPNAPGVKAGDSTDNMGNKAGMGWDEAIRSFQTGGVFQDREGLAMLHGPEAIVPLPNGRSIPVEIVKGGSMFDQIRRLAGIISPQVRLANQVYDAISSMTDTTPLGQTPASQTQANFDFSRLQNIMEINTQLLGDLVLAQRTSNDISGRILQAANN